MSDSCVLLEAFKQLVDPAPNGNDLVTMSKQSSQRARSMLGKLCKKPRKPVTKSVPTTVSPVPPVPQQKVEEPSTKAPTTSTASMREASPRNPVIPKGPSNTTSMVYYANEAKLADNKLRIYIQNIRVITKGEDYFSIDLNDSVQLLKVTLDVRGSLSAILATGSVVELRDVHDVKYFVSTASDQKIVEFSLGEMQASDGGELDSILTDIKLFFGNLPSTR